MATHVDICSAKILIIDDQLANVKLLEKTLISEGFQFVEGVTDPQLGLELYSEKRHDLVLLDIRMPILNGFQVMEKMQDLENNSYIPVLVLTAQTDMDTRKQALEKGARDFLTKPFDRIEALCRIRNLLEVHLLQKEIKSYNCELEIRVRQRTRELHDTRLEIIRRLGRASEYRDNETGMHISRMSHYSEIIARRLGMDDKFCEMILDASPMHDLGKIGIPDSILLKPGKLDPTEWEIMKTHAAIGAELLAGCEAPLLEMARNIALTHHERWDGSGYPQGLAGEQIPLVGRIATLADVFDALTSARPYKVAWSVEQAVQEIRSQNGRQFDGRIVEVFERVLPEILSVKQRFADPELH
ncbi:MAG: response regulator [Magnetococcales bacterium]|nr:response regulator [Magnetococcales bacterium]NGZ26581.1 response regulator [Magnetococcales bacterium]